MAGNAPPSAPDGADGDASSTLWFLLRKFLSQVDDALPAQVVAYNQSKNLAEVKILTPRVTVLGESVSRQPLSSVPVMRFGVPGMVFQGCPAAGSLGWIKAMDRDIYPFLQGLTEAQPDTQHMHDFINSVFIPDGMRTVVIAAEDQGYSTLQKADGSMRLSFLASVMKVTAPQMAIGDVSGYAVRTGALLDLVTTSKALGLPTMNTAQKASISAEQGFMVYDTTLNRVSTYNGSMWT